MKKAPKRFLIFLGILISPLILFILNELRIKISWDIQDWLNQRQITN